MIELAAGCRTSWHAPFSKEETAKKRDCTQLRISEASRLRPHGVSEDAAPVVRLAEGGAQSGCGVSLSSFQSISVRNI